MSTFNVSELDCQLSAHIRHLLLSYVHTHITIPYIQFTESLVSELLSDLAPIPTHDPTTLLLPTDPLAEYLSTVSTTLEPYTEKLQTTNDARLLIKQLLGSKPYKPIKFSDGHDGEDTYKLYLPGTPTILTRRAVRETPVLRKIRSGPKTYSDFSKGAAEYPFLPVPLQEMSEPDVNFDHVLDVRYHISAGSRDAVRTLLKSVAKLPPRENPHAFLPSSLIPNLTVSPEKTSPPSSPPFMPIFPRRVPLCTPAKRRRSWSRGSEGRSSKRPDTKLTPLPVPESVIELADFLKSSNSQDDRKVDLDAWDVDLCKENMVVVDGWQTYVTSSPSIRSDSNEEDKLYLPSSPDTDVSGVALTKDLERSKLEEIEIPRVRKAGRSSNEGRDTNEVAKAMSMGYGSFITSVLRLDKPAIPPPRAETPAGSNLGGADKDVESSLHGQVSAASEPQDADLEILQLYTQKLLGPPTNSISGTQNTHIEHPHDIIRNEALFDDEIRTSDTSSMKKASKEFITNSIGALIPVPRLPEPNVQVGRLAIPMKLKDYVVNTTGHAQETNQETYRFLTKTKGIAGLRVALSWVPFTLSNSADLPDHNKVVDVHIPPAITDGAESQIQALLKRSQVFGNVTNDEGANLGVGDCLWSTLDDVMWCGSELESKSMRCDIILTRGERMGLSKRRMELAARNKVDDVPVTTMEDEDKEHQRNRDKRKGVHDDNPSRDFEQRRVKQKCLIDEMDVNDSGIWMLTNDFDNNYLEKGETLDFLANTREDEVGQGIFITADGDHLAFDEDKENCSPLALSMVDGEYVYRGDVKENDFRDFPGVMYDTAFGEDLQKSLGTEDSNIETNEQYENFLVGPESHLDSPNYYAWLDEHEYRDDDDLLENTGEGACSYYVGGSFEPLSFDSQKFQGASGHSSQVLPQDDISEEEPQIQEENTVLTHTFLSLGHELLNVENSPPGQLGNTGELQLSCFGTQVTKITDEPISIPMAHSIGLASHTLGIDAFARLRAKTIKNIPKDPIDLTPSPSRTAEDQRVQTTGPPAGLFDKKTLQLSSDYRVSGARHRYLASLDILQKQVLIRALRSQNIDLVERYTLRGADLILDASTAVIFAPLLSLPAHTQAEALLAKVTNISWDFVKLLVVFEAYSSSLSVRAAKPISLAAPTGNAPPRTAAAGTTPAIFSAGDKGLGSGSGLYAYTPPIMKAIKKFRRDLDIAEACGTKDANCVVQYAFADSVAQAAAYARMFGDNAEAGSSTDVGIMIETDTEGPESLWGDRAWLDLDPDENEGDLAAVSGMNIFKASVVLCQVPLGDFLDMRPDERMDVFGKLIGEASVTAFNSEIECRRRALEEEPVGV